MTPQHEASDKPAARPTLAEDLPRRPRRAKYGSFHLGFTPCIGWQHITQIGTQRGDRIEGGTALDLSTLPYWLSAPRIRITVHRESKSLSLEAASRPQGTAMQLGDSFLSIVKTSEVS